MGCNWSNCLNSENSLKRICRSAENSEKNISYRWYYVPDPCKISWSNSVLFVIVKKCWTSGVIVCFWSLLCYCNLNLYLLFLTNQIEFEHEFCMDVEHIFYGCIMMEVIRWNLSKHALLTFTLKHFLNGQIAHSRLKRSFLKLSGSTYDIYIVVCWIIKWKLHFPWYNLRWQYKFNSELCFGSCI